MSLSPRQSAEGRSPEHTGERPRPDIPEESLAHVSEVLRQSDLEVSSSGTSRPEQEEWGATLRQAVGYVAGDVPWSEGEAWPQVFAANVLGAISNYVPDGWMQEDPAASAESRSRGAVATVAAAETSAEGSAAEMKGVEAHAKDIRQRFDSMASTSLSDTETKEDGDETSAKSGCASPRGLEAALKELGHYKFDPERGDRKTQSLFPDLPAAPKELPPPVPLKEPSLPEEEPVAPAQEETTWWQRLAELSPVCLTCAFPSTQAICNESEECIEEKACCCKPICWRTRPDGEAAVP